VTLRIVFLCVLNAGYNRLFVKVSAFISFVPQLDELVLDELPYIVFAHVNVP